MSIWNKKPPSYQMAAWQAGDWYYHKDKMDAWLDKLMKQQLEDKQILIDRINELEPKAEKWDALGVDKIPVTENFDWKKGYTNYLTFVAQESVKYQQRMETKVQHLAEDIAQVTETMKAWRNKCWAVYEIIQVEENSIILGGQRILMDVSFSYTLSQLKKALEDI